MQKNYLYSAAMLCSLILTVSGCYCDGKNTVEPIKEVDTLGICLEYVDSVGPVHIRCSMKGVLPNVQNKRLRRIVNEWINERLGGTCFITDTQNTSSILLHYQKSWMDSTRTWVNELPHGLSACIRELEFQIIAQNKKYITLSLSSYLYEGGAHGSTIIGQQTFRIEDGRELGWDSMFNMEKKHKVRELIKDGLMRYFAVKSGESLKDYLLIPEQEYKIPFPVTPPVLLDDGVMFIYQQYEIAPYAFGLPRTVVPYSEIRPLLSTTVLELLD